MVGRMQIQADNVANLLDKLRVCRELERVDAMRLQAEGLPDARDGRLRQAHDVRHRARAPLRRGRRCLQRPGDDVDHLIVGHFPWRARPRFVGEPFEAARAKPLAPFTDAVARHVQASGDRAVRQALGARRHHARPQGQTLRRGGPARPLIQRPAFVFSQQQRFTVALSRHAAQSTSAVAEVQDFF